MGRVCLSLLRITGSYYYHKNLYATRIPTNLIVTALSWPKLVRKIKILLHTFLKIRVAKMISISDFMEYMEELSLQPSSDSSDQSDCERTRSKPPEKHPLLKKLEEVSSNDPFKHADYTSHLLIQRQARQYVGAVDDVLRVLKDATLTMSKCKSLWRGADGLSLATFGESFKEIAESCELTQIARGIIMVSAAFKRLQENDALTFWTGTQRCKVMKHFIQLARDGVKLRRKMGRIKQGLEEKLKNVEDTARRHQIDVSPCLETSGVIVKEQTVEEGSKPEVADVLDQAPSLKEKFSRTKTTAMTYVSCIPEVENDAIAKGTTTPATTTPEDVEVQVLHAKSYQNEEVSSVCSVSSQDGSVQTDSGNENVVKPKTYLTPEASQKCLEIIASNVTPKLSFKSSEFVYDQRDSCIKQVYQEPQLNAILEDSPQLEETRSTLDFTADEPSEFAEIEMRIPTWSIYDSKPQDSTEPEVSLMINLKTAMTNVISEVTYIIRDMERNWLSPELMAKSKSIGKELFHLVDFIVDTVKLTDDEAFSSRLYPEDLEEIVSTLGPVAKELSRCITACQYLYDTIVIDLKYLKQLVSGLNKKGSLIVRDYLSDMSIDLQEAEVDMAQSSDEFNVDINELFE